MDSPETLQYILQLFRSLPLDTRGFLLAILIVAVGFHVRFTPRVVALGPTLLTTTGIFATFFGVARGLSEFDTANVQASIPALLAGLKTAFWASVFGVGAALTLKLRELLFGGAESGTDSVSDEVSAADLARHLGNIRNAINGGDEGSLISQMKLARQDMNERLAPLKDIQRGLLGAEDGSLITQLRLLRQDMNDRMDALLKAQTEALQKLAEMGTGALVEALRDVIRDFNERITEQFGDNFRELNNAVRLLVGWQENYKTTIDATFSRLEEMLRLFSKASEDFGTMAERSRSFADVAERLGQLLTALTDGESRLRDVAQGLASLLQTASGSLPQVEQKVMELTTHMSNAVRDNQEIVRTAMTESATTIRSATELLQKDVSTLTLELSVSLLESQRVVGKTIEDNSKVISATLDSTREQMSTANRDFNRHLEDLLQKTRDQFVALDSALASELTKSLEGLGRQLTALSEHFVKDYEPLTKRLKEIVALARG